MARHCFLGSGECFDWLVMHLKDWKIYDREVWKKACGWTSGNE